MLKILYFAWLKEKTGVSEEDFALPDDDMDVMALMGLLQTRSDGFAAAFADLSTVRVAVLE